MHPSPLRQELPCRDYKRAEAENWPELTRCYSSRKALGRVDLRVPGPLPWLLRSIRPPYSRSPGTPSATTKCSSVQMTLGERPSVVATGERNAESRIALGVSDRSALTTWSCARRSRGPEQITLQREFTSACRTGAGCAYHLVCFGRSDLGVTVVAPNLRAGAACALAQASRRHAT